MTDAPKTPELNRYSPHAVDGGADDYGQMENDEYGDYYACEDVDPILKETRAEVDVLRAEAAWLRVERDALRDALKPFGRALALYRHFDQHQLILLSEDNPKGRRLAHLFPENFRTAEALAPGDPA